MEGRSSPTILSISELPRRPAALLPRRLKPTPERVNFDRISEKFN
jgi:hypothetical protein